MECEVTVLVSLLSGDGGDSHSLLASGVLVEGDELDTPHLTLWYTAGLLQPHTHTHHIRNR